MLAATARLEPGGIALERTLRVLPEIEVQAERIAAHSTTWTMPCLWIKHDDFDAVDAALAADPSVSSIIERTTFEDETFYHIDWNDDVYERINAYVNHEGSLLHAEATGTGWEVRFRFMSRDQFDQFRKRLAAGGHSFELIALTRPADPRHMGGALTPGQREALRSAADRGYYDIPRAISTRDLADELEMSHQNLSKLLRRGTGTLIEETLEASADG